MPFELGAFVVGKLADVVLKLAGEPIKTKDFALFDPRCEFTDDSVLTIAVAEAFLTGSSYLPPIRRLGQRYPAAGYGTRFTQWLHADDPQPYNSWGNGSAMRVSPVGFAFDSEDTLRTGAERIPAQGSTCQSNP